MAPQWETFFIGDMPSRRDHTVAENFMFMNRKYQSLQGKKADHSVPVNDLASPGLRKTD